MSSRAIEERNSSIDVSSRDSQNRSALNKPAALSGEKHLMGYDWIAGLMDNKSLEQHHPDKFYDDLKLFRRSNRDECYGSSVVNL